MKKYGLHAGSMFPARVAWAVLCYQLFRVKGFAVTYAAGAILFFVVLGFFILASPSMMVVYGVVLVVSGYYIWISPATLYLRKLRELRPKFPPGNYETAFDEDAFYVRNPITKNRIPYGQIEELSAQCGFVFFSRAGNAARLVYPKELFPQEQVERLQEKINRR